MSHPHDVVPDVPDEIRCKVTLWNLHDVNLVDGTFEVQFRVTLFWSPSAEEETTKAVLEVMRSHWKGSSKLQVTDRSHGLIGSVVVNVPPLALINAQSFSEVTPPELHLVEPRPGRVLLRWNCLYQAKLIEPAIANEQGIYPFPYDSHELSIDMGVRFGPLHDVPLRPIQPEDNATRSMLTTAAGVVEEAVVLTEFLISPDMPIVVDESNVLHANIKIWRKHNYIEVNVLQLNALLQLMGFCTFAFPAEELSDRMSMAVGVLFATVGLRQLVDGLMPKLEFMSLAQNQLNASIYVIFAVVVESAFASMVHRIFGSDHSDAATTVAHIIDGITCATVLSTLAVSYIEVYRCRAAHLQMRPVREESGRDTLKMV